MFDFLMRGKPSFSSMDINKVDTLENPFLLDVRELDETAEGIIEGAHLIPLGQLPGRTDQLPKDEAIYVICRSGNRSRKACDFLSDQGFQCVNMTGGMKSYTGQTVKD
nr:rhodanese-like domain-containing protein [uncultured Peptoniphilus sp.]